MPSGFCCSDEIVDRVTETINSLESHEVSQLNIRKAHANFCSIVGEKMKQKLKSKVIVFSNSVNMNKKKRIKKPWWNDNLTYLVNDMCYAEQIWKTGKIRRSWVRTSVGLNQRLYNWHRLLPRCTRSIKE
jgi:hypothetical protein